MCLLNFFLRTNSAGPNSSGSILVFVHADGHFNVCVCTHASVHVAICTAVLKACFVHDLCGGVADLAS